MKQILIKCLEYESTKELSCVTIHGITSQTNIWCWKRRKIKGTHYHILREAQSGVVGLDCRHIFDILYSVVVTHIEL